MWKDKIKLDNNTLMKVLFLLAFWMTWLILPFLNVGDNERMRHFMIEMIPVNLTLIPLFFINSEILVPRIFQKRKVAFYLLSLVILIAIFMLLHMFMKEALLSEERYHGFNFMRTFYPILTVVAVSSGYGLIDYLIKQDKRHEEEQQERLKSELSFLRSQISPHFIFNVLNSIVYLIRSKSDQAEDITIKLSEIMQYMLYSSGEEMVPLEREISYLKNYIELQETRFGEDVAIDYHIKGEIANHLIEPMLIIPFVENAFKHGVSKVEHPHIEIWIEVVNNKMVLKVQNKFDPSSNGEKEQAGIGLKNVRRRLELLYPGSHQLHISDHNDIFVTELTLEFDK